MSGKAYSMEFKLNAGLGSNFNASFTNAQNELKKMQTEIENLNKAQSNISAYERQQAAIEATAKKYEALKASYDKIQKEIDETGDKDGALAVKQAEIGEKITSTSNKMNQQQEKLNKLSKALSDAGVDTSNLGSEQQRLATELSETKEKQEEAAEAAEKNGHAMTEAFDAAASAIVAAGIDKALGAVVDALKECTEAAMEYENVMAGVKRTVGGDDDFIAALGASFKELSTNIPITTTELAEIATTAGQLGVAQADVEEFTAIMAKLATTTDLTADNAATMLAQFANVTGNKDYEHLGSVVAALGDATATTASKVVEMSQGMAASATIAGMSATDILAISAAVGSLGIEAQAGSTSMSTLINTIYTSVETGGDALEQFASVAGMNAAEFSVAWKTDPVNALNAFIQGLNNTERNGKSAIVLLNEMGITNVRQTKAVLGLASAGELLTSTIELGNKAWEENTALQDKASIMYETTQAKLTMMQNAWNNLKIAVGDNFTPTLGSAYDKLTELINGLTQFTNNNPALVKSITTVVTGLLGMAAAVVSVSAAVKAFKALNLSAAFTGVPGVLLAVGAAVTVLTAAVVGLTTAYQNSKTEYDKYSATTRAQYDELEELKAQYNDVCERVGETSAEAVLLAQNIDEATAAFEANKQTAEELTAEHEKVMSSYRDMADSFSEETDNLSADEAKINSLVSELETLMASEDNSTEAMVRKQAIVSALNNLVPDLGLSYDSLADSLNMTNAELESSTGNWTRAAKAQAQYNQLVSLYEVQTELAKNLADQTEELTNRQAEYNAAEAEYIAAGGQFGEAAASNGLGLADEAQALSAASAALAVQKSVTDEATDAVNENQAAIDALVSEYGEYVEATNDAAGGTATATEEITSELNDLAAAYGDAYDAALESIKGQIGLFDTFEAEVDEDTDSVEEMMQIWAEQTANLASYTENLKLAAQYGLDDGLIASLSDGSAESAGYLATIISHIQELESESDGMDASGVQTFVDEFNASFEGTQEAQNTFAETVAAIETDLDTALTELETKASEVDFTGFQTAVESAFAGLDADFTSIGGNVGAGLSAGIDASSVTAATASAEMAQSVTDAAKSTLCVNSPSTVFTDIGTDVDLGISGGIANGQASVVAAVTTMGNAMIVEMTAKSAELKAEFEAFIPTLDMSSAAYAAGYATINGYYAGAKSMLSSVQSVFSSIITAMNNVAYAARNASSAMSSVSYASGRGYASGTRNAERGFAYVGEQGPELVFFRGGETVLNASDTAALMNTYQGYMGEVNAYADGTTTLGSVVHSVEENHGGATVTVAPVYHITTMGESSEIDNVLQKNTAELRELIEDVLEDVAVESARKGYR